ncbi:MAG TPA: MBL fold metallo-hydrolase [Thioalkalivibrio sp.]|nr:MBL fold metallo-hydrolase [Thioalkalivibrio sp.]
MPDRYAFAGIGIAVILGCLVAMSSEASAQTTGQPHHGLLLQVVYNNVPYREDLTTGWGFACLIEGLDDTVLFDTGSDGEILLSNMERVGVDAGDVDVVVLSHIHGDHTGGLDAFLARRGGVTVFVPASFPAAFGQRVVEHGARMVSVSGPRLLVERVHSTGEMGHATREQALIVETARGLVVMTGCAHPDVADMAERAKDYLDQDIHLLMGGFHLGGRSDAEIRAIIARLKALGVEWVAPSHCTGERVMSLFREAWGEHYIEGGLGARIEVPE